jgi:hypothetical protein
MIQALEFALTHHEQLVEGYHEIALDHSPSPGTQP